MPWNSFPSCKVARPMSVMLSSVDIWEFHKLGIELYLRAEIEKKKSDDDDKINVCEGAIFVSCCPETMQKKERRACAALRFPESQASQGTMILPFLCIWKVDNSQTEILHSTWPPAERLAHCA